VSSAALRDGILAVPVIDITSFRMPYADAAARSEVVRQVDAAARSVGFMQITGHGIPATTLHEFTGAIDAFFALDALAKARYRCPPGINRGYTPPKAESLANSLGLVSAADLFEAMNVGTSARDFPELDLPGDVYAENVYPADEVPGFEAAVTEWFQAAGRVARTMVRIFGAALGGREDYFAQFTDHSIDVLRMNNYRLPSPGSELEKDQLGMGAHTDYGIVTVLWADQVPGLEIHGADGRRDGPLDERGVDLHPAPCRRAEVQRSPRPAALRRLFPRRQRGRGDPSPAQLRHRGQPGQVRSGHGRRAPRRQAGGLPRWPAEPLRGQGSGAPGPRPALGPDIALDVNRCERCRATMS
jgi:isopenicillin N synthase-like dioxygenase